MNVTSKMEVRQLPTLVLLKIAKCLPASDRYELARCCRQLLALQRFSPRLFFQTELRFNQIIATASNPKGWELASTTYLEPPISFWDPNWNQIVHFHNSPPIDQIVSNLRPFCSGHSVVVRDICISDQRRFAMIQQILARLDCQPTRLVLEYRSSILIDMSRLSSSIRLFLHGLRPKTLVVRTDPTREAGFHQFGQAKRPTFLRFPSDTLPVSQHYFEKVVFHNVKVHTDAILSTIGANRIHFKSGPWTDVANTCACNLFSISDQLLRDYLNGSLEGLMKRTHRVRYTMICGRWCKFGEVQRIWSVIKTSATFFEDMTSSLAHQAGVFQRCRRSNDRIFELRVDAESIQLLFDVLPYDQKRDSILSWQ